MSARTTESPMAIYRRHLQQGHLAYQYSPTAKAAVFYPRIIDPHTGSDGLEWRISAGTGTVYAATVVHTSKDARHCVVLVDMDEGFRILSRIEGIAPEAVRIDMRVKVRIRFPAADATAAAEESPYPVFESIDA